MRIIYLTISLVLAVVLFFTANLAIAQRDTIDNLKRYTDYSYQLTLAWQSYAKYWEDEYQRLSENPPVQIKPVFIEKPVYVTEYVLQEIIKEVPYEIDLGEGLYTTTDLIARLEYQRYTHVWMVSFMRAGLVAEGSYGLGSIDDQVEIILKYDRIIATVKALVNKAMGQDFYTGTASYEGMQNGGEDNGGDDDDGGDNGEDNGHGWGRGGNPDKGKK